MSNAASMSRATACAASRSSALPIIAASGSDMPSSIRPERLDAGRRAGRVDGHEHAGNAQLHDVGLAPHHPVTPVSSYPQRFPATRARLTADGKLVLCLFSDRSVDLKRLLRTGADDREILAAHGRHEHLPDAG
ncbi:MAG: hypothetical protein B7Z20_02615, partial [Sphingobium sp. 32-64-5]